MVDARLRAMAEENARMAEENASLHEALIGSESTNRVLGSRVAHLERELTKEREDSPEATQIRALLTYWKEKTRSKATIRTAVKAGASRWDMMKRGLRSYSFEECKEAIDGATLAPYVVYGVRKAGGAREDHKNDVHNIFGNEARTEECLRIAREAKLAPEDVIYDRWVRVASIEQALAQELLDCATRMPNLGEPA
jgi:hypothetical protein